MAIQRSKLEEISQMMRNNNVESVMEKGVLELTEIVQGERDTEHVKSCVQGYGSASGGVDYADGGCVNEKNGENLVCDKCNIGCGVKQGGGIAQSYNVSDSYVTDGMKAVVNSVIKSEIRKWLNQHLAQIVQSEVKRAID